MSLGTLVLDLTLNGGQFTVSLNSATGALARFVLGANNANAALNRTQSGFRQFGRLLRDTVLTLALARDAIRTVAEATLGWQKTIADTNGQMQRSIALMKSFSKETDPVKATAQAMADVNMLLTKASNAPFSLKAITDSFVKLRVSGIEPINQGFDALVDSVAQFGGSDEQLKRASVAIQQMAGKGVVSMEELRQQLGEAVPTAIQQMADGLGVTYSKLVKDISLGKVKSEPAIIAMFREMELQSKGSAERMMNTWQGATAQLNTEFTKLMLTVGGFQEGYGEGTYMHGITSGIKELTTILKDPATQASAKAFGEGLTAIMKSAVEGLKWIIQYRSEIYELGKAFLTIYAATKAVTIIRSLGGAFAGLVGSVAGAGGAIKTQMAAINTSFGTFTSGVAAMRNGSTAAAGAMSAMRGILGTIGGAAAIATGPIGLLTAAVAAGAYSWWEYKKAAQAGIQAMIDAKGQGAGLKEIMDAQAKIKQNNDDIASLQRDNQIATKPNGMLDELAKNYIDVVGNNAKIKKAQEENAQLMDAIAVGEANVIKSRANVEFEAAKSAISNGMVKVEKEYDAAMQKQRDRLAQGEKDGTGKSDEFMAESKAQKYAIERTRLQAEAELYNQQLDKIQQEIEQKAEKTSNGTVIGLDEKAIAARKLTLNQLRVALGEVGQKQEELVASSKEFSDTVMNPGGGGAQKPAAFDMLTIFVDGMRKKLATLDAKVEETNPYLAQLEATIESLGGVHLPNFDKMVADGKAFAEQTWALEKAQKAVTASSKEYTEAQERVGQISSLITAKLAKVENLNPWEKASADAVRYQEELDDMLAKLEETKRAAYTAQVQGSGEGLLKKLEAEAVTTGAAVDQLRAKIEQLKVSDTAKKMQEDANSMSDALLSNTDRVKQQYDRQTQWADEFYANHKDQLANDAAATASYNAYREQLNEQYNRDSESGLQEWIRTNKDATEQYKSLWGSAMDKFNDTLVDGLMNGKLELADFVEYVLKEFLRIQMAKQMAMAADAVSGAGGFLGTIASGIGSYFGGAGANGFAAGSAGATSSSLGASQAGYSSLYGFADGGIMTDQGAVALRKYAKGGIADRPQLALYGEGSMNEAFVPLPDGRTIPVTVSGTGAGNGMTKQATGAVPVQVNVYNQGGEQQEAQSSSKFDGEQMVVDIILKKVSQPGPVRDAVRTAAQ
ncbi:tail tape-measure protein [Pseudomonas phage nickie]|uniref:Tail tape-measure protein n=1 Tax=Pseudomonas phage nickie TaxID=2048977 RepID=A0A2H4P708_9CAUD|nr:tail length tape measure protein [Pseudomonas phage nickie]ATW57959.1 tail tape-measure protein [Pseudomonas phage nickie]